MRDGKIYKLGRFIKPNGDMYIGQFKNGLANGYGRFYQKGQGEPLY